MSNLANTLRMYAEDMHSATGYSERSSAMSKAADMIEQLEQERDASRDMLDSTRLELELLREAIRGGLEMFKHEKTDECLSKCPQCGGGADNGLDRCIPQSAYMCKKCCEIEVEERAAVDATHNAEVTGGRKEE